MMRDPASQRQVDAANPHVSTWLAANAGSGKTRVLTDRVARLLLEGVSPQNILCLTYTKAAAAEMQNRLFKRLGAWAMMPDNALRENLNTLGIDRRIDDAELRTARKLFATAIETPGGLKIQTIHSFCASILRRFPLEARVSPQFREMEDRDAERLRADVVDEMLEGDKAAAVHTLLAHFTGDDLSKLTAEIASNQPKFLNPINRDQIRSVVGLDPQLTEAALVDRVLSERDLQHIRDLRQVCDGGSKTDVTAAATLQRLTPDGPPTLSDLILLESVFLTGEGAKNPFSAKIGTFPTKAIRQAHEDLMTDIEPIMQRVQDARQDRLALNAVIRTMALYDFAQSFTSAYEARKLSLGALDFDDLIRKSKALLLDPNVAQWVLFRLDGGIDHILVDEAQDTSPTQWAVIKQLAQEFASGEGARSEKRRTIFVVGDKKQSIYSFQGADPAAFDQMKDHFKSAHDAIDQPFETTTLDFSFRSAQSILSVVDATFADEFVEGQDDQLSHIAFQTDMPGRVDLWPMIEKTTQDDDRKWYHPVDQKSATDHTILMANCIVEQIQHIIKNERLPVKAEHSNRYQSRNITEGDFLILVQRRSELFAEIIRACKNAGLQIAGADRLRVGAELAVKDIAALLNFLALPEDDLSLACALRSPLFGWSEQDLFTLAHHRPAKSYLWTALREGDYPTTLTILNDLRKQADFLRPYDLIERILIRHDGRRKLLGQLGPEAEDGIDALLSQALSYESTGVPSLTGFLTWMETDDLEVKRQMDNQGDRIRVMTVHGAKGLEAPIVILPDTAKRRNEIRQDLLPAGDHIVWKTPKDASPNAILDLRDKVSAAAERERARLLYVAMTRAENWLIVGAAGDVGEGSESWYNTVAQGMKQRGDFQTTSGDLQIRRVADLPWDGLDMQPPKAAHGKIFTPPAFHPLPDITRQETIAPSDLPGSKVLPGAYDIDETENALTRGTVLHSLLEHLPTVDAAARQTVAQQITDDASLIARALALIEHPDLTQLWADTTLAEVGISADIPGLGRIHGTLDRLIVTANSVTAIDYKSNRHVPNSATATPVGILNQLAVYDAALAQIYPDRVIETAILWTETASLMPIPKNLLHETLNGLTSP
ncbi:MAG: double-strand break repair helicase AddA [Pseudomonadota bacterium]